MNKLYEAIVAILQGFLKLWEYFKGRKSEKDTAQIAEKNKAAAEHDKEVDTKTKEKVEEVKLGKSEGEDAEAVSSGLDDYFGGKK